MSKKFCPCELNTEKMAPVIIPFLSSVLVAIMYLFFVFNLGFPSNSKGYLAWEFFRTGSLLAIVGLSIYLAHSEFLILQKSVEDNIALKNAYCEDKLKELPKNTCKSIEKEQKTLNYIQIFANSSYIIIAVLITIFYLKSLKTKKMLTFFFLVISAILSSLTLKYKAKALSDSAV